MSANPTAKWLGLSLATLVIAFVCFSLGQWQMGRHDEKVQRNAQVAEQRTATPVPLTSVLRSAAPSAEAEWTHVTATGRYLPTTTVVVLHRTFANQAGLEVVTLFAVDNGPIVAVDRGWLPNPRGDPLAAVPDPPEGSVRLIGWIRRDGEGPSTEVHNRMTRAISGKAIGVALGEESASGFVMADSETPTAAIPLTPPQLPDASVGPHRLYAWQWRFFAALALVGFFAAARGEMRRRRGLQTPH